MILMLLYMLCTKEWMSIQIKKSVVENKISKPDRRDINLK